MRKKFVFATPTLGLTVKRRTQAATTYEIENIRAGLEAIISQKQEEDCVFDVVCNLVDAMGEACASLTRDDAEYLLGRFSVLADSVLETLATIASSGIEWTAGAAYGGHKVDVSLCLINDIEILMKRINSVFYCMSHTMGLESLERALDLLGRFRGVSPIPDPRLYITSVPCWRCVGELMVLPNHGNPSTAEGTHVSCNHLAVPVNPEPVSGLFENEVRQAGLGHLLEAEEKARPAAQRRARSRARGGRTMV